MSSPAHSSIGASSMDRWSACPGSVRLSKDLPSITSVYAEEGTLAHSLAADWLINGVEPKFPDEAMRDAVMVYVGYIQPKQPFATCYFEHKFDLSQVHPGCFGTADCVLWYAEAKHLEVIDYKHGAGVFVPVVNNPQLRYYGLGALLDLKLPAETITLTIVQPRYDAVDGTIRSETLNVIDFLDFMADLKRYAQATEDPNAPLIPGEHCGWCPAKQHRVCPELDKQAMEIVKTEFGPTTAYTPESLKDALDKREVVKNWLKALDEFAYNVLERGGEIPGYKLVAKRPTRKWKDEALVVSTLKAAGYKDAVIYETPAPKSPAQMEKALGKEKGILSELIVSESSGHTIAESTDPRPAVKMSAKQEFLADPVGSVFD